MEQSALRTKRNLKQKDSHKISFKRTLVPLDIKEALRKRPENEYRYKEAESVDHGLFWDYWHW